MQSVRGLLHTYHSKAEFMADLTVHTAYAPISLPCRRKKYVSSNPIEFPPTALR